MSKEFQKLNIEQDLPRFNIKETHWDFIFTCFEPLENVTGGIGKYIKLLIASLACDNKKLLVLTRALNKNFNFPKGVQPIFVDERPINRHLSFVGDEHDHFSFYCHLAFRALSRSGHSFGIVEFSDYGVEGFYPLRAVAAGSYSFEKTIVRLHSPEMMLINDNGGSHFNLSTFLRDRIDREVSVYEDVDVIVYGGEAMRERILSLTSNYTKIDTEKLQKCHHPLDISSFESYSSNASKILDEKLAKAIDSSVTITLSGRIEHRKGQVLFFLNLLDDPQITEFIVRHRIVFVFCGQNVMTSGKDLLLFQKLRDRIKKACLEEHFVFLGKLNSDELTNVLSCSDEFIFPSVFENYPNALLETLPFSRPTLISKHGCMEEITTGFKDIFVFDPNCVDENLVLDFLHATLAKKGLSDESESTNRLGILSSRQKQMCDWYFNMSDIHKTKEPAVELSSDLTVGFIVPVFQNYSFLSETLVSCIASMKQGDKIVVVDDGSDPANADAIKSICRKHGVEYLSLDRNSGPLAARIAGARNCNTDLIQFCDSDDILEPSGIFLCRTAFQKDRSLGALCGVMACFGTEAHLWVPRNGHIWTGLHDNFSHSGAMFNRAQFLEAFSAEPPNVEVNEDWLANLILIASGCKFRMTPEITYHYRRFPQSRSSVNSHHFFSVQKTMVEKTWRSLNFFDQATASRIRLMHEFTENNTHEQLKLARKKPHKIMVDLILFRVLTALSELTGILPQRRISKFKRSAAKRDPDR